MPLTIKKFSPHILVEGQFRTDRKSSRGHFRTSIRSPFFLGDGMLSRNERFIVCFNDGGSHSEMIDRKWIIDHSVKVLLLDEKKLIWEATAPCLSHNYVSISDDGRVLILWNEERDTTPTNATIVDHSGTVLMEARMNAIITWGEISLDGKFAAVKTCNGPNASEEDSCIVAVLDIDGKRESDRRWSNDESFMESKGIFFQRGGSQ